TFPEVSESDRGWVLCPEYSGDRPVEISPLGWDTRVFMFGPGLLPDTESQKVPTPLDSLEIESILSDETTTPSQSAVEPTASELQSGDTKSADASSLPSSQTKSGDLVTLGSDVLTGQEVQWSVSIKGNPHLLIAGLPGMGKTTCLLNICKQMLN